MLMLLFYAKLNGLGIAWKFVLFGKQILVSTFEPNYTFLAAFTRTPEGKKRMEAAKRRRRRVLLCPHHTYCLPLAKGWKKQMQLIIDSAAIPDTLVNCCMCIIFFFFFCGDFSE
ncbi:hypothetical protein D1007_33564 [Hordeum vulgare]|nr:hypothetical protein D1007_33564 [Hordeum vulgare]